MKSMMNVKGGLRALALAVGTCLVGTAAVGDSLWIGGASGNWGDVNNWSGGAVPNGADAVVRIESTSDVTVSVGSGTYTVGALIASGGNHKILGTGRLNLSASSGTGVVEVAENASLMTGCFIDASVAQGTALAKTGTGTFSVTNKVGRTRKLNGMDVRAGLVEFGGRSNSDDVDLGVMLVIRTGATVRLMVPNLFWNDTVIYTEPGSVFDANGKADLIGALVGEGIVTNCSNGISMTLYNGPHKFSGHVFGKVLAEWKSNGQWYFNCPSEKRLWVVGTRDALADASFLFNSQNPGDRLISFAPEAGGEFVIKELGYRYGQPFVLTDTGGNPVTVLTTPDPTARATGRVTGEGSLTALGWASYSATFTNDMMTAKGTYALTSGTNTLGNGTAEKDAVVTSLAAVDVQRWATLVRRNATNETWDTTELIGMGTVVQDAPSDWRLPLSMTGGTFRVTARAGANEVEFNGGNSTNVTLDLNSAPTARIVFSGGSHHFKTLSGSDTRTYLQTGGVVYAEPICGHWTAASKSDIFYTMTGGKFYSTADTTYSRGLGLEMSGNAEAHLRWTGAKWYHRLASDGESHTIRLRDNAYLTVDRMDLATPSNNVHTAIFDLQGGTFEVSEWLNIPSWSEANYPNYTGRIVFDGGTLRSTSPERGYWCSWNLRGKFTAYIGANGGRIDVPRSRWLHGVLRIIAPFVSGVSDGVDGGLEKTGMGGFVFENPATYTGPTRVLGGTLRSTATDTHVGAAPFGTGPVLLENGMLLTTRAVNHTMASAPGATVTYRGGSILGSLEANTDQLLTLGPTGAAADSVLVRDGHGVLALMVRNAANMTLGGSWKFKVNGGLSLDANTRLVTVPVFGYFAAAGGWWYVTFLTYDDTVGFKEPTYVEGLGGGNASVARISSAKVTLSADAHVGALDMRLAAGKGGLSIADGKTLTIGNGAGTRATLLMNSCNHTASSANRSQTITGRGALDFGAAEGLVVCNQSCRENFSYVAGQINCPIRGTGGMTFAGLAEHTGHSDLELGAANTYTGGTWIENLCVKPMVNGAFSSGAVTVDGSMTTGGGIWIPSNSQMTTLPNALTLSGNGRFTDLGNDKNLLETFGALRADRTVNMTGAITLPADTRISAFNGATRLTLSGGMSGAGKLFVSGSGTVVLPGANSYTGGTVVDGILEVQNAAALGTGPVTVTADGTLRFANASPLTIANAISGEGTIEFAGSAPVTLTAADGFAGTRRATAGVTTAGYDLVKDGDDTMTLTAANTYGGETRVLGGTLALGPQPVDALPCPEAISLRLDADDADTRTMNGDNVVAWADADGRGITLTNSATATSPVLNEGAINGKDTLFFGGLLHRMVSDKGVAARTVFIVNKFPPEDTPHPNIAMPTGQHSWNYAGIMGDAGVDCGIRVMANGKWIQNDWTDSADIYCNGQQTVFFNWDTPQISTFALTRTHDATAQIVVGDYWASTNYYRGFFGDVAEVLVYDRHLEDAERQAVESYLGEKWGIAIAPVGVATNVLPATTGVTVADGAALDLAGRVQTVASLAGAGAVTNSGLSQATLSVGSLDGFDGTLAGNVRLEITGATTLSADATIDPGIDLYLAPGAILDLNGRTITVRNASGSGIVRNGTLVVTGQDDRRSPATVIIFR